MGGTIDYQVFIDLPPSMLLDSLLDLHLSIFDGQTRHEVIAEFVYHQARGPFLLYLAVSNGCVLGYKAGYERKPGHFYSWIGCVDPASRSRGIATTLMHQQHEWCRQHGYQTVHTHTYNKWRSMLMLNLKHGFDIVGTQQGKYGLLIMLEKLLMADKS